MIRGVADPPWGSNSLPPSPPRAVHGFEEDAGDQFSLCTPSLSDKRSPTASIRADCGETAEGALRGPSTADHMPARSSSFLMLPFWAPGDSPERADTLSFHLSDGGTRVLYPAELKVGQGVQ